MTSAELLYARLIKPMMTPCSFMGVDCFVRHFSELEIIEWRDYLATLKADKNDDPLVRCKLLARTLCDEDGVLIFGKDGFEKVAECSSQEIGRLFDEIIQIQKEKHEDEDEKKDNDSTTNPDSASLSDSPPNSEEQSKSLSQASEDSVSTN